MNPNKHTPGSLPGDIRIIRDGRNTTFWRWEATGWVFLYVMTI